MENGVTYVVTLFFFDLHYLDPKYPTIEHVLAIKNGGTHSWDNVKVACRDCNIRKSTTMVEEFMKGVD
ncbi:HNH endonuclease [Staphylococcus arlettae]|uniref:HNH endonuclease n=1 Tax=Staphylococcus arlettae TaxID=29378 RepID=UPI003A92319C